MKTLLTCADLPDDPRAFLAGHLRDIREVVDAAARCSGRDPSDIRVLPVTKYVDVDVMRELAAVGVCDFGESRVQILEAKREALRDLPDARFHLIGHLQRNKAGKALRHAASIHSIDSQRLLDELETRIVRDDLVAPDLYIEVNISEEDQKTGGAIEELSALLIDAANKPHVGRAIRGLMGMAPYATDPETSRPYFRRLRELRDAMRDRALLPADAGLSMGMSNDFPVAVEEGATIVRVGSLLYEPQEEA